MKKYYVLIIGLGSIGRRHIKILKKTIDCNIIVFRQKNKTREDIPAVEDYIFNWDDLHGENINFAIISNPPVFHINTAINLAKKNIPFIIEKPVCVSMNKVPQLLKIVQDKNLPVLVGFNLRYHYLYKKIKEIIASNELGQIFSFLAETGQYLPEWRDYNYTKSYSACKALGGGVIYDLTHEIDLAVDLLGKVNYLSCFKNKVSSLNIDTEDIAEITMSHNNGSISHIHLDYLQKEYTRRFKLIFEKGEIFWDYSLGKIKITSKERSSELSQLKNYTRDNTFKNQLKHWFDVLNGKEKPLISLKEGIYISKIAICTHKSADQKRWIKIV